jgi:hypothetical protein
MSDATTPQEGSGKQPGNPRTLPVAAIAGALVLVGLVGVALYRRSTGKTASPAPPEAAAGAPDTASPPDATSGTTIAVKAPVHLSPEAAILAERYRCVCGCNDSLPVCTCRNPNGSEDMKTFLQDLARQGLAPEEADRKMSERFGAGALLSNPAPPQTQPSHAGPPPHIGPQPHAGTPTHDGPPPHPR